MQGKYSRSVAATIHASILRTAREFAQLAIDDEAEAAALASMDVDEDAFDDFRFAAERELELRQPREQVDLLQLAGTNYRSKGPQTITAGRWVSYYNKVSGQWSVLVVMAV